MAEPWATILADPTSPFDRYALRLAIVLQPRSPLAVALAQVTALLPRDLERVAADEGLAPLVQLAARRVATGR